MSHKTPVYTPDWMKVTEAAARLSVDRKTIHNRLKTGALPVRSLRFGRVVRLNRREFDAYLDSVSIPAASSA